MHIVKHITTAEDAGYPQVEVEFNVGVTGAQIDAAVAETAAHVFVTDLPNWDAIAADIGAVDADGAPLAKPAMPLTSETANTLPVILSIWLMTGLGVRGAVRNYLEHVVVPNFTRR